MLNNDNELKQSNKICVGKIISAHGVRGEVKLHSYTENPLDILKYNPLTNLAGTRSFKFIKRSANKDILIVRVEGIESRNDAELLRNIKLYIDRNVLPKINKKNVFYIEDLKGLEVLNIIDKTKYGKVIAVVNYGSCDILVVKKIDNSEEMFSFTKDNFPEVNVSEGYLVIDVPEVVE